MLNSCHEWNTLYKIYLPPKFNIKRAGDSWSLGRKAFIFGTNGAYILLCKYTTKDKFVANCRFLEKKLHILFTLVSFVKGSYMSVRDICCHILPLPDNIYCRRKWSFLSKIIFMWLFMCWKMIKRGSVRHMMECLYRKLRCEQNEVHRRNFNSVSWIDLMHFGY